MDLGRIRVLLLLQTPFDRAALPPLLASEPLIRVADRSGMDLEAVLFDGGPQPHIVVMGAGPSVEGDCDLVRALSIRFAVPVVVVVPASTPVDHRVACLEAGAVDSLAFDPGPSPSQLIAFQSLLVGRIKSLYLLWRASRSYRPSASSQTPTGTTPPLDTTGQNGHLGLAGATGQHPHVIGSRHDGKPRSPLEPQGGWTLVQPDRQGGFVNSDTDRRAEVAVFSVGWGGVEPFCTIVSRLPADTRLAGLAVVRLPSSQLHALVRRLNARSEVSVQIAGEGDPVARGVVLLAPPGRHLSLVRTGRIPRALCRLEAPDPGSVVAPRIDSVMRAVARIYGTGAAAVVLSGADADGVAGLGFNRKEGGINLVLDPRDVGVGKTNLLCIDAGVVDQVVSGKHLPDRVLSLGKPLVVGAATSSPEPGADTQTP